MEIVKTIVLIMTLLSLMNGTGQVIRIIAVKISVYIVVILLSV